MRIGFLHEGAYAPYPKWFGTAFKKLSLASKVEPVLVRALTAQSWKEAETHLLDAYSFILQKHEDQGLLSKGKYAPGDYYGRPYKVVFAGEIASELIEKVKGGRIRKLRRIGAIDQAFENIDVTNFKRLQRSYTQLVAST